MKSIRLSNRQSKVNAFFGMFLAATVLLFSCQNDNDGQLQGPEPVMPPATSMAPDMSLFEEEGGEADRISEMNHWGYAALNVGVYSAILYTHLVVPVTAFKATIDQEAHYNEDAGLWVWEKAFEVPSKGTFAVRLTAEVEGTEVSWTGYISKSGEIENFVWFTGTSQLNGESGSWNLYESPDNPQVWLSNTWEYDREAGTGTTTFTVEKEGDHKGSSITYEVNAGADLDRSVVINNASVSNMIYVDWSKASKFGRVKSEAYFGDDLYHCWDSTLQNVSCE